MCCGCACNWFWQCSGQFIYVIERTCRCCALTAVVSCFIATYLITLGIGIGLGYNYCFVDYKTQRIESQTTTDMPEDLHVRSMTDPPLSLRRTILNDRSTDYSLSPIIIVPLHSEANVSALVERIRKERKNVTLQILAV